MTLPPIGAETILYVGSLPVTNSMINSTIAMVVLVMIGLIIRSKKSLVPRGLQNFVESIVEFMLKQAEAVTGSAEKARKFLPLAGSLFIFILLSNWLGLLPGTGSIGMYQLVHGEIELVPLLRPANADLNLTVAMAIISVIMVNLLGVMAIGFFAHAGKFINFKGFVHAFHEKGIGNIAIGLFRAIIEFFVGLLEIISEVARVLSLSLRLFGNIFAGEVLITVIAGLFAFILPLPFMALELLVGVIQATVFAMLVLVYASVATEKAH